MTTQDWLPDLQDDPEQSEAARPSRRRWLIAGAGALATLLALVAVVVEVDPLTAPRPDGSGAAASPSAAPTPTAARPAPAALLIRAQLNDPRITPGGDGGPLTVGVLPIEGGAAPDRVPNFDSCHADPTTLQYLPVQIQLRGAPDYLSATFEVQPTASTPPDIDRVGFFFQAGRESTPCPDGVWPPSDSFLANLQQQHITGYVVLDQAFTPTTPQGRADVLRSLQLRVSNIRLNGRPTEVGAPTAGSLCPGTSDELCATLG